VLRSGGSALEKSACRACRDHAHEGASIHRIPRLKIVLGIHGNSPLSVVVSSVEREHVRAPLFDPIGRSKNKPPTLITEAIFCDMIDRIIGSIAHDGIRVTAFVCRRG
jgi:hypothetical protein